MNKCIIRIHAQHLMCTQIHPMCRYFSERHSCKPADSVGGKLKIFVLWVRLVLIMAKATSSFSAKKINETKANKHGWHECCLCATATLCVQCYLYFLNPLWKTSLSDSITIKCHTQSILSSIFRSCDPEIRLDMLLSDPVKSHENRLIIISVKAWVGIQGCLWGFFNQITHYSV